MPTTLLSHPRHLLITLLLSPAMAWAQGGAYTLQGQLGSPKQPTKAYLLYKGGKSEKLDSTSVKNGSFVFRGAVAAPVEAMLYVVPPGTHLNLRGPVSAVSVYLERGIIKAISPNSISQATITGTRLNADNARLGAAARPMDERIDKLAGLGTQAPDFTQPDVQGKPVSLRDYRGQYVLVDFWASWCGPCRQESPNVVAAFNQYKNRNFTVLGISLDRPTGRAAWLKAIEADQLPWTQVSDLKCWDNEAAQRYGIETIPRSFLIDPEGRIIAKDLHGDDLGKKLAAVLPATGP